MDATLFGMVTDVRPLQPLKALSPMNVTPFGIVTDVRPLQSKKAPKPIDVTIKVVPVTLTCSGIITSPLLPVIRN